MSSNIKKSNSDSLQKSDNPIENRFLLLGEQYFQILIRHILFMNITQESKYTHLIIQSLNNERLLKILSDTLLDDSSYWECGDYGISEKMRITFRAFGNYITTNGYDRVYNLAQNKLLPYLIAKSKLPIITPQEVIEKYYLKKHLRQLRYKVHIFKDYSINDKVYSASVILNGINYEEKGYCKKSAIRNLCEELLTIIPETEINDYLSENNIKIKENNKFEINTIEVKSDENVSSLSEIYAIEPVLLYIALLPKSQFSKAFKTLGFFLVKNQDNKTFKRYFAYLGHELLRLFILEKTLSHAMWDDIDISEFDICNPSLSPAVIISQMDKMIKISDFANEIFVKLNLPESDYTSEKLRHEAVYCFISAYFLSNYEPDKKIWNDFSEIYNKVLANGIIKNIDYQFSVVSFLSIFGIRPEITSEEIDNNTFSTVLKINKKECSPSFSYVGNSRKENRNKCWEIAYQQIVLPFKDVITKENIKIDSELFVYFIKRLANKFTYNNIINRIPDTVLEAKCVKSIGADVYKRIILNIRDIIKEKDVFNSFVTSIIGFNSMSFIVKDDKIYTFNEFINLIINNHDRGKHINDKNDLSDIYLQVINPNVNYEKAMLKENLLSMELIKDISFEVAKFALDIDIESFKYIVSPSEDIIEYYNNKMVELDKQSFFPMPNTNIHNVFILDSYRPLHLQIIELLNGELITDIIIACGYIFNSGLKYIDSIIDSTLSANGKVSFVVGALQGYSEDTDNVLTGIDQNTAKQLNVYLKNENFTLFTCKNRFYHGKLFYFESEKHTVIIIGSSNVSHSAFASNLELNIAFVFENEDGLKNSFKEWINKLIINCVQINNLDENRFGTNELQMVGSVVIKHISSDTIKRRIDELTNSEIQYRMNLWMQHSPDVIAEDLGIIALPDYFIFVYSKYRLIVLESFSVGNSYFCLNYEQSFESVINDISSFTKTEIFEYSRMTKRGYHIKNKLTLESNINSYFH